MIICEPGIKPKNKHLQSLLASSKIRLWKLRKNNPVLQKEKEEIIQTKEALLQGFYTANEKADDLYILLHGWEGSAQSTYIQTLSNTLYKEKNASIYRLNFRDHGDTHHLNKDLFHSCRLNEVVQAIKHISKEYPYKNLFICGFSLGANFSLRVAAFADRAKIPLKSVFAVSPPINPKNSMISIEKSHLYSNYFLKKWKKSLAKKQALYPESFDTNQYKSIKSLEKLTEMLILKHSDYNSTDEYFAGYQITQKILDQIKTPCHVITAWDDPVIPFDDFKLLQNQTNIQLVTTKQGGHCGFINSWNLNSWIEHYIIKNSF